MKIICLKEGGMMMRNKVRVYLACMTLVLGLGACSNIKYLPEGEHLYVKGQVEIESDTIPEQFIKPLAASLEELLRPEPNTTILGLRPQLYAYNIAGEPRSARGLRSWLKYTVGEEPVYLSDVNRDYNENLLRNRLENLGFFNAEVTSDTTTRKRKATITYMAEPKIIYRVNSVAFDVDSTELGKAIKETQKNTLLVEGRRYSLDQIIAERVRIDDELKNKGFYYFNPDYILVEVDSTLGNHQVDLFVMVKKETPERARTAYRINNIFIYPDYKQDARGGYPRTTTRRATSYDGGRLYFVDPNRAFRHFSIARAMFFSKGDLYTRRNHNRALNNLVGMNTFSFVRNDFVEVDSAGIKKLDVYYYLTPMPKQGIRVELLGKTADVYNGFEVNTNWTRRNFFRSGELFNLSVYGGFETQTGGNVNLNSSFYRYGVEASLTFPRLIAPFDWRPTRNFVPKTFFRTGYEFLNRRQAYSLNSMSFSFGYLWKEDIEKEHELDLAEVIYVQPRNVTEWYQSQVDSLPYLRHAIDPTFTFGPKYMFTYTNTMQQHLKHTLYYKGGLDLSANVYGLIRGANYKEGKVYQIFNANFSQYVKIDSDFRHYMKLGTNSVLASRIMAGYGYSYGNSSMLPYVKQFFAGGPNGLRSFRARAIGPGSYVPENLGNENFFADQTGDIQLEMNVEYRAKLASIINWAVFLDAGNVWLQNSTPDKPGGHFTRNFYNEIGVGAGFGLRFDFSFLILRADLAMPIRLPYIPESGNRWVMNQINFRDSEWRRNNLIFNLAIGYPF